MIGKIFITRTGYDPVLGKHVKDPYLGEIPSIGACRPDFREKLMEGDHLFVISGKVPKANQFVMGGFEVYKKIHAKQAYHEYPEQRLKEMEDGQLDGNIILDDGFEQHKLDDHNSFDRRIKNYIVGKNPIVVQTPEEISRCRAETMDALCEIIKPKKQNPKIPIDVVGRWGSEINERQIGALHDWISSIKEGR